MRDRAWIIFEGSRCYICKLVFSGVMMSSSLSDNFFRYIFWHISSSTNWVIYPFRISFILIKLTYVQLPVNRQLTSDFITIKNCTLQIIIDVELLLISSSAKVFVLIIKVFQYKELLIFVNYLSLILSRQFLAGHLFLDTHLHL